MSDCAASSRAGSKLGLQVNWRNLPDGCSRQAHDLACREVDVNLRHGGRTLVNYGGIANNSFIKKALCARNVLALRS